MAASQEGAKTAPTQTHVEYTGEVTRAPVLAYAKICGPDFEYYVQTLSITLGRLGLGKNSRVDIDLTGYEGVEERHATITHDFAKSAFKIQCDAHWANIAVNGREIKRGVEPCLLRTMDTIRIGDCSMYFLLPVGEVSTDLSPIDLRTQSKLPGRRHLPRASPPNTDPYPYRSRQPQGHPPPQQYSPYYSPYPAQQPPRAYSSEHIARSEQSDFQHGVKRPGHEESDSDPGTDDDDESFHAPIHRMSYNVPHISAQHLPAPITPKRPKGSKHAPASSSHTSRAGELLHAPKA